MRTLRSLLLLLTVTLAVAGCGRRLDPRAQEAYDMVARGDIDQAIAFVNSILVDEPDNAQVRNVLGLALYKSGDLEGARDQYLEALEDDPKFPEAYFNLGNAYKMLGETAQAESSFVRAIRYQKRFVLAHYNLGVLYMNSGRKDDAIAQFRRAVDYDDQFYPAFLELGLLLAETGDNDGAITNLERTLELAPTLKRVRVHLGNAYLRSGREGSAQLAENEFKAAVGIDPDYVDGLYSLGVAYATQGRQDDAVAQFDRVYRLTADDPEGRIHKQVVAYFKEIGHTPPDSTQAGTGSSG